MSTRSEPFATVSELLGKHSEGEILEALAHHAEFEFKDVNWVRASFLCQELYALLDRMERFEALINGEYELLFWPRCHEQEGGGT